MVDTRVVMGARCTWWDSIDKVATKEGSGIPACPHCGNVLFQHDDEAAFMEPVLKYDRDHSGYVEFITWLRGRCFTSINNAKAIYYSETGKTYTD